MWKGRSEDENEGGTARYSALDTSKGEYVLAGPDQTRRGMPLRHVGRHVEPVRVVC